MYIDEAGVENTLDYAYSWSLRGSRCFAEKLGHATERVSMIAARYQNKVFAPMTFTGYCDSLVVETWFEQVLVPTLSPKQVVILDNASFHRKARLQQLLEPLGCCLLALPPYSPDLVLDKTAHRKGAPQGGEVPTKFQPSGPVRNRIEPLWNRLKALIEHHPDLNRSFRDKVDG